MNPSEANHDQATKTPAKGVAVNCLNLAHWGVTDGVNGPGRRFTVWAQGCPRHCPGCFNPDLLGDEPRRQVSAWELAEAFAAAGPVEGVVLSGGEPFAQAAGLSEFLEILPWRGDGRSSVVVFSGYTLEELRGGPAPWLRLLGQVDLLVDGPYRAELTEAAPPLAGSVNQRRVALTPLGEELLGQVDAAPRGEVQVEITERGEVVVSGFPDPALLAALARVG